MMLYTFIVFVAGILLNITSSIFVEKEAADMIERQQQHYDQQTEADKEYLCDASAYMVFDEWMSTSPLLITNQLIIFVQIVIFFVFVRKISEALNEQKQTEIRLYGFDEDRYEQ